MTNMVLVIRISLMTFWESIFNKMVEDGVGVLTKYNDRIEKVHVDLFLPRNVKMIKL